MKFFKIKSSKKIASMVLGSIFCSISAGVTQAATIDLLVLYDSHSNNYFKGDVETAMLGWINQMNTAYRDSQVDIQLRLVGTRPHEESGANMSEVLSNLRVDSQAIAMRDRLGADFVSQLHQTGSCGIGYLSVNKNYTWNVLAPNCGPMVMAHELGHNMGLAHSRRQGDTGGSRFGYALGYGVDNVFSTIMAYPSVFKTTRFNRFSNPNIQCRGLPCGVAVGNSQEAYAALALSNVSNEMAAFRPTAGTVSSTSSSVLKSSSSSSLRSSSSVVRSSSLSSVVRSSSVRSSLASSSSIGGPFGLTVEAEDASTSRGLYVRNSNDIGGGTYMGRVDTQDWMLFNNITIPTSGSYTVEYRISSVNGGGKMNFDLFDPETGIKTLATVVIPKTGDTQSWTTIREEVTIEAGTYKFGIYGLTGGWNINWWRITK